LKGKNYHKKEAVGIVEGKIKNANKEAEKLLVYTHEELLSSNLYDFFDIKDSSEIKSQILNNIKKNYLFNKIETLIKNKLNTFIVVEISSACLKIQDFFNYKFQNFIL